jgi:hypothetical protein
MKNFFLIVSLGLLALFAIPSLARCDTNSAVSGSSLPVQKHIWRIYEQAEGILPSMRVTLFTDGSMTGAAGRGSYKVTDGNIEFTVETEDGTPKKRYGSITYGQLVITRDYGPDSYVRVHS